MIRFWDFLRKNVFDIIAAVPLVGILRGLKIIRAIKIVRMARGAKATKVIKMHKTAKFFSEESAFNTVQAKKKKKSVKKKTVKRK